MDVRALLLLSAFAAVTLPAFSERTKRIVGGSVSQAGQFPYMVSLQQMKAWEDSYRHYCGGSILNERWILTAAHCVFKKSKSELQVVAGEQNLKITEGFEQIRSIERIVIQENFTSYLNGFDIALLEVSEPFDFSSKYVSPIDLPSKGANISNDCVASGWGYTESDWTFSEPPDEMHFITVPMLPHQTCKESWPYEDITDHMICAGYEEGGKDICVGDSGGPLICRSSDGKNNVVGVVSFTNELCAFAGQPSVYTRVRSFMNWIELYI